MAQARVNELCNQLPCESGLYCVKLKSGEEKCSECDQSKSDGLTAKVDEACKAFDGAWTPDNSPEYLAVLSTDQRVQVAVYDLMLEKAKECKAAREYRESECWDGGDQTHRDAIAAIGQSITRISDHKLRQIRDRRVYYGSKDTYESKLSTFNSKCSGSTLDAANRGLDELNTAFNKIASDTASTEKIDCSDIEDHVEACQTCSESANALLYDGYQNNVDYMPREYFNTWDSSEKIVKKGQELLAKVKEKNLCK
jgi:hypothetical protein